MAILSRRMQAVANLVTSGYRLADVGTDHGYVPISLVQEGRVPYAYAMDINKGPLEKASANIRHYGLEEKITTGLGDGLACLKPGDADSILIAGMGGELVIHILTEGAAVRDAAKELILQPQSDIRKVRAYLRENGYTITEEEMILEDGKYYPMMRAVKSDEKGTGAGRTFRFQISDIYGPILLQKKHPILLSYLEKEHAKLQTILSGFKGKEETENLIRSRQDIEQKLAYNEEALEIMR